MKLKSNAPRRMASFAATIVFSVVAVFARPDINTSLTSQQTDSLNQAVAVVMASSLKPVINNLVNTGLPVDPALVGKYIADALNGRNFGMTAPQANLFVEKMIHKVSRLSDESQKDFMTKAAKENGAIVTPSGVVLQIIVEGEGVNPTLQDKVGVRYVGRLSDGTVFDDTQNDIVVFDNLDEQIPGFVEGLLMMKPGGKYRLVIPPDQAYGEEGIPGIIPGNAVLDFTVSVESVNPSQPSEQ